MTLIKQRNMFVVKEGREEREIEGEKKERKKKEKKKTNVNYC